MKKKLLGLLGLALLASSFLQFHTYSNNQAVEVSAKYTPSTTFNNHDGDTYYSSISDSSTGTTLLNDLHKLNSSRRKKTVGYSAMGTSVGSSAYVYTDYDTSNANSIHYDSNGQPYGDYISSFYTYTKATGWNREHVWVNTHGGGNVDADIHMTRPTISSENSSRGHAYYVDNPSKNSQTAFDPKVAGYDERSRGEAARIILYCAIADTNLKLEIGNSSCSTMNNKTMGDLETLMKWHCEYDITEREKNRNEGAEYLQGNRNPFIDHPEYAVKIWGNQSSNIQKYCENPVWSTPTPPTPINAPVLDIYRGDGNGANKENETKIETNSINLVKDEVASIVLYVNGIRQENKDSSISSEVSNNDVVDASTYYNVNYRLIPKANGSTKITFTKSYYDEGIIKYISKSVTINVSGFDDIGGGGGDDKETDSFSITYKDLPTSYNDCDIKVNGYSFTLHNVANYSNNMQFKKSDSYIYTTNPIPKLYKVKVKTASGSSSSFKIGFGQNKDGAKNNLSEINSNGNSSLNNTYFYLTNSTSKAAYTTEIIIELLKEETQKILTNLEYTGTYKSDYIEGEIFNPTGLIILANYSDGSSVDITEEISWPTDELIFGQTSVQISYQNKTLDLNIAVSKKEIPLPTLTSISYAGRYKSNYIEGEIFDPTGLKIFANYSDDSKVEITNEISWPTEPLKLNQTDITISYNEKLIIISITVIEKEKENENMYGGCGGSIAAASLIVTVLAITGLVLLLIRKKKQQF